MQFVFLLAGLFFATMARGAEAPAVQHTPSQTEDLALPASADDPGNSPGLLPESTEIPERNPRGASATLRHQGSIPTTPTRSQRLSEVRAEAMRNPHALELLHRAHRTSSARLRRRYLRAYYATVRFQMHQLDPGWRSSSNSYQQARIGDPVPFSKRGKKRTLSRQTASRHHHRTVHSYHSHRYYRVYYPEYEEDFPPPPFYYSGPPPW
jgi:hypothetical protein